MINILWILLAAFPFISGIPATDEPVIITGKAQGTSYTIRYYHMAGRVNKAAIDSVLEELDRSLSLYRKGSLINRFNAAKDTLTVDRHMVSVVIRAGEISRQTRGAFDMTVAPLVALWGFGPGGVRNVPGDEAVKAALACTGYKNIRLKNNVLSKALPCIQIDANGIAQGYSVDVLARFLERHGIGNYLVELGGEIRVKGRKPDGSAFRVAIESPGEEWEQRIEQIVDLESGALTTSGSYKNYYESQGKRITHLIDPRTGYTVQNELISVTVHAPDAITADGLDNALMLMGLKNAMKFVEKRRDIAAFFIFKKADGSIADTASSRFVQLLSK